MKRDRNEKREETEMKRDIMRRETPEHYIHIRFVFGINWQLHIHIWGLFGINYVIFLSRTVCLLLQPEMVVTAEVSKMAAHSVTVAWRKRGHSESEIMCRGNSSPRVIQVTVKPVNLDLQKHTCAVMFSQVLLKSSSHSSWHRHVGFPLFSQMGSSTCCCHNTSESISVHMFSSSPTAVAGTQCLGSSTLDQRMELAGFSSRGRCVGGSSERSNVRSLV